MTELGVRRLALLTAWTGLLVAPVPAQTGGGFDLSWSTIDGGGGTSAAGTFSLLGSIGQPDAGTLIGGSFTLQGGFLAAAGAITPTPTPTITPTPTATPTPLPLPATIDYTEGGGNAHGWIGGAVPGFGGTTSINAAGICMTVPGPGDNFTLWVSPERLFDLTADTVYRVRLNLSTDQTTPDAIPIFFLIYDNFNSSGEGNNYGGFFWVLDVDGDAQGIDRPLGRTSFDFYVTPNATNTPQWNATAFTPQADAQNDIRLQYRIIDANVSINTNLDAGTICIGSANISAHLRSTLTLQSSVFNPALDTSTHFAQANSDFGGGTAQLDNVAHTARYQINVAGDNRRTLGPFDPSKPNLNQQLYPVVWEADTLYRVRVRVRAETAENDPIEAIFLAADTTNVELGMTQFTTRGRPGGAMDRAASPRLTAAEYESYFYSHNATMSATLDAGRLRPLAFFFNSTVLFGDTTGADAFVVESLEVDKLLSPL